MHCYEDLRPDDTETESSVDGVADTDAEWDAATSDGSTTGTTTQTGADAPTTGRDSSSGGGGGSILDDDGLIDNSLTVVVGLVGGIVVGIVGTTVLGVATSSVWAIPVGIGGWLLATAYLVRRDTVQAAVAHSGYAIALVFLTIPLLALSPAVSVAGGIAGRLDTFAGYSIVSVILAALPAGVGWIASRFVSSE